MRNFRDLINTSSAVEVYSEPVNNYVIGIIEIFFKKFVVDDDVEVEQVFFTVIANFEKNTFKYKNPGAPTVDIVNGREIFETLLELIDKEWVRSHNERPGFIVYDGPLGQPGNRN